VYHDNNGSKRITLSASWAFNGTYSGTYVGTITASAQVTLDTIPRQSSIESVVTDSNNNLYIRLTKYVETFIDEVFISFGEYSLGFADVKDYLEYTIPKHWLATIPDKLSGLGQIKVITYTAGYGYKVGETVREFIVTVPDSVIPTIGDISWTHRYPRKEPSDWPMTKNVSQGTLKVTGAQGASGSYITSYSLTFAGLSSNTDTLIVDNIASYGELEAIATVTDSRGRSCTKTVTFTVADYSKPLITVSAYRSNHVGNEDVLGEYLTVQASATVSPVGNNELFILQLDYKKPSEKWYSTDFFVPGDKSTLTVEASSDNTWEWVVTAEDLVSAVTVSGTIATGKVVLDILADGSGIKFGSVCEEPGFHSDWDYTGKNMKVDQLTINDEVVSDFVVRQGRLNTWTYRQWSSGLAECWGYKTLDSINVSTAWGTWYYSSEIILPSYPILFKEIPCVSLCLQSDHSAVLDGLRGGTVSYPGATYLYRPFSETGVTGRIAIYAYGRWK
jgi:hypothetical protein